MLVSKLVAESARELSPVVLVHVDLHVFLQLGRLPHDKVVKETHEVLHGLSWLSSHVERAPPLDEADFVGILAIGNDQTNASVRQLVERRGDAFGLGLGLLEEILERVPAERASRSGAKQQLLRQATTTANYTLHHNGTNATASG